MKQIIKANEATMGILGKANTSASNNRMMHYCASVEVEEGILLFNLLTRELLLLTPEEYANALKLPYLREQWFVVPQETDEKKLVEKVRWVQKCMERKPKRITGYTILTTTDCNARCFYCYEKGIARIPMTEETAMKTVDFIKSNCGGKKVHLAWFGGEPLYNHGVINLICESLRKEGIEYFSTMTSNGYLFNDELVQKAATLWKLMRVQITLDGTESVYNRCKAFIYEKGNAYQIVMENIGRLLDAGVPVKIRMNMDFHNAEDLTELVEILGDRFGGKPGLTVYSHLLFNLDESWDERYTMEQWNELYEIQWRLEDRIEQLGMRAKEGLRRKLPSNFCMADNSRTLLITPTGHLSKCEHFSDKELIGHIDTPERDETIIANFRKRCEDMPECATCFYYPECIRLEKCEDLSPCIPSERVSIRRRTQKAMVNEFCRWQNNEVVEENEEVNIQC